MPWSGSEIILTTRFAYPFGIVDFTISSVLSVEAPSIMMCSIVIMEISGKYFYGGLCQQNKPFHFLYAVRYGSP
jgi:hypothetical protein